MTIETINDRIQKNEVKIQKKTDLIQKKQKQITKKVADLQNRFGYQYTGKKQYTNELTEQGFTRDQAHDIYWIVCDIRQLEDDLDRLPKEIAEIKKTLENQKAQRDGLVKKESMFVNEVPESMKEMEQNLIAEWNRWDTERREQLSKLYDEVGYKEFFRNHTYADYEMIYKTDEELAKDNARDARNEVIDLFNRVKGITGEVTDWSGIVLENGNSFPVLTGLVIGKEGRAHVETVLAGGYNIQRLHIRTLVHEI